MRRKLLFLGIAAIFLFAIAAIGERINEVVPEDNVSHFIISGKAGIPHQINYQGYLTDGADNAITDTLEMTLRIYDTPSGGTELWSETQSSVSVVGGLFNVLLGSVNEIPSSVFGNSACWLQIEIEGEILSPRSQIASVGYAFRADTADFAIAASTDNDWQIIGNDMYSIPSGNIGIGTDEPQTTLDIYDSDAPAEITLRTGLLGGSNAINFTAGNWAIRSVLTVPPMALSFLYGSNEVMTLQGENVGIGTANPTKKLDVNGNVIVRGDALEVVGGAGSYIKIGTESEGYATTFSYESDTSSGMYDTYIRNPCGRGVGCDLIIDFPYGNVGIGATTPAEKLDVAGTAQMTGFKMPTGASAGYVLTSDSAGVGTWQALAADGIGGSGTANYIPKFTDTTTLGNSVIYETGGNIGIGTTDPSGAKLRVAGGLMVTNNGSIMFETGHTANVMKILNQNVGIGTINPQGYKLYVNGKAAAPSGWYSQYFKSYSGNYLYIDAGDNGTDITIRPSDGRVGIGTTSPNDYLDVYGRVRARHRGGTYAGFIVADAAGTFKGGFVLNGTIGPSIYADGQGYVVNVRNDNGNVGIGTANPTTKLHVNGDATITGSLTTNGVSMGKIYLTSSGTIISTDGGTRVLYWDKTNGDIEITNTSGDWCDYWWQAQKGGATSGNSGAIITGSSNVAIISGTNANDYGFEVHFGHADGTDGWCSVWLQYANGRLVGHYIKY